MKTSVMIHRILDIKTEIVKYENPIAYVRNINIKTEQGNFTINLFSRIEENLIFNKI